MKKIFALIFAFFFCFIFTSCALEGSENQTTDLIDLSGVYKFQSLSHQSLEGRETVYSNSYYEGVYYDENEFILTLHRDKTFYFEVNMFGSYDSIDGTWSSVNNEKVLLLPYEDQTQTLSFFVENNLLKLSISNSENEFYTFILVRAYSI
jgi:hypothetical protein